jgi:hypothetical protein
MAEPHRSSATFTAPSRPQQQHCEEDRLDICLVRERTGRLPNRCCDARWRDPINPRASRVLPASTSATASEWIPRRRATPVLRGRSCVRRRARQLPLRTLGLEALEAWGFRVVLRCGTPASLLRRSGASRPGSVHGSCRRNRFGTTGAARRHRAIRRLGRAPAPATRRASRWRARI